MDYKINKEVLLKLLEAKTEEEVTKLINNHSFFKNCEWIRYGDDGSRPYFNNSGFIKGQSPEPVGAIVEIHHDEKGIVWPESVAPYQAHLVGIMNQESGIMEKADDVYEKLIKAGVEVLFDDREDASIGQKFADADLIGIPVRLVVSEKTAGKVEWKKRSEAKTEILSLDEVIKRLEKVG